MKKITSLCLVFLLFLSVLLPAVQGDSGNPDYDATLVTDQLINIDDIEEDISADNYDLVRIMDPEPMQPSMAFRIEKVLTTRSLLDFMKNEATIGASYAAIPKENGWYYYKERVGTENVPRYAIPFVIDGIGGAHIGNFDKVKMPDHFILRQSLTNPGKYKFFFDGYTTDTPYRRIVESGDMTLYAGPIPVLGWELSYELEKSNYTGTYYFKNFKVIAAEQDALKQKFENNYNVYLVTLKDLQTPEILDPEATSFVDFQNSFVKLDAENAKKLFFETGDLTLDSGDFIAGRKNGFYYAQKNGAPAGILVMEGEIGAGVDYAKKTWGLIAGSELLGPLFVEEVRADNKEYLLAVPENTIISRKKGLFLTSGSDFMYNKGFTSYDHEDSFYDIYLQPEMVRVGVGLRAYLSYTTQSFPYKSELIKNLNLTRIYIRSTNSGEKARLLGDLRNASQTLVTTPSRDLNYSDQYDRITSSTSVGNAKFLFNDVSFADAIRGDYHPDPFFYINEGRIDVSYQSISSIYSEFSGFRANAYSDREGIRYAENMLTTEYDVNFFIPNQHRIASGEKIKLKRSREFVTSQSERSTPPPTDDGLQPSCDPDKFGDVTPYTKNTLPGTFRGAHMFNGLIDTPSYEIVKHSGKISDGTFTVEVLSPRGGYLRDQLDRLPDGDYVLFLKAPDGSYFRKPIGDGSAALRFAVPFRKKNGIISFYFEMEGFPYIDKKVGSSPTGIVRSEMITQHGLPFGLGYVEDECQNMFEIFITDGFITGDGWEEYKEERNDPVPPPPADPQVTPPAPVPPAPEVLLPYVPEKQEEETPAPKPEPKEEEVPVPPVPEKEEPEPVPASQEELPEVPIPEGVRVKIPNNFEGSPYHIPDSDKDYIFIWDGNGYQFDRIEDIPQGVTILPQTAGIHPVLFFLFGAVLVLGGIVWKKM